MAGDLHGRDALLDWLGRLRPLGFWLTEEDVFGNDEHVCALSMGARRGTVEVERRVVNVFRYGDRQQLEMQLHFLYPD